MQAKQSWFGDQAFGESADALVTVTYKSHQEAIKFMLSVLEERNGVGLLQGPKLSGKTTIVKRLSEKLSHGTAVAVVDAARIKPRELLSRMLAQYGYDTGLESHDELMKMMSVFAIQQTRAAQPLVLVIDNADRMYPSALRVLDTLAELKMQDRYAIRIIVTGGSGLKALIESEGMRNLAKRVVDSFLLSPLSLHEALLYLHARLQACGVNNADTVFPVDVCDRLYQQSGGWPGLMNKYARDAISRATDFPLRVTDTFAPSEGEDEESTRDIPAIKLEKPSAPLPPKLVVSKDGHRVAHCKLTDKKMLIGRSDFTDIVIEDDFVSKLHAVLITYADALVLLDLNSANGTTVNSVRVRSTILRNNDVISLGNHRLKVENAPVISKELEKLLTTPDTLKMKNLIDMRRLKAQQRIYAAPDSKKKS